MSKVTAHNREKGFSLIETMLAMLFLAVSFLALAQLVAVAINQNSMSRSTSVGISAAMGKLEEVRRIYNQQLETGNVALTGKTEEKNGLEITWVASNPPGTTKVWIVTVTARPLAGEYLNSRTVEITSYFAP